jgi:hypothetical protein
MSDLRPTEGGPIQPRATQTGYHDEALAGRQPLISLSGRGLNAPSVSVQSASTVMVPIGAGSGCAGELLRPSIAEYDQAKALVARDATWNASNGGLRLRDEPQHCEATRG